MTGFGRAEAGAGKNFSISAEVSSINRKQLELRVSLPSDFSRFELDVRSAAAEYFSRGAVSVRISIKSADNANGMLSLPDAEKFDELIRYVAAARQRLSLSFP